MYDELMALEEDLQREQFELNALTAALQAVETTGVSRELVMGMESHCPELVTATTPLQSYTAYPSDTNRSIAMESLKDNILRSIVKGIIAAIRFYYRVSAWIIEKVATLAFNTMLNKATGNNTTFWEDVRVTFMSDDNLKVAEHYRDKSKTMAAVYIEEHAAELPKDDEFYKMLIDLTVPTGEALDALGEAVSNMMAAVKADDADGLSRVRTELEQTLPRSFARLWNSPLVQYADSLDTFLDSAPIHPDTEAAKRQASNPPPLEAPEAPVIIEVLRARRTILDHLRGERRAGVPKVKSVEKLIASGQLRSTEAPRSQAEFKKASTELSERLDELLSQVEGIDLPRSSEVHPRDLYNLSGMVQKLTTTVARFGTAQQIAIMVQGDLNQTRTTMVRAFESAMELKSKLEARAKAEKEIR